MRLLRFFRPSHQHTAFSATLLLMAAITLSRVIGYIREAYIAYAFGAGQQTDAYVAAFTLPDWLNYIVAGGVVAGRQMGIASLAFGALAGSIAGPFLINAIGAAKIGTGYRPSFDVKNPAFREWVRLSIPLMLGVSLVTADDWILRYFASSGIG